MTKQPNILFIMTDQQHARMMSCAGNQYLKTPAMDSLAQDGIRFEKAYCSNPVCAPSRISMVTGMMSCRLDAESNEAVGPNHALPPEVVEHSMGNTMKNAGYDTFYGGKVHLTPELDPADAGYNSVFRNDREELPGACLDFIKQERDKPFFAVASFINPHDICFAYRAKNGINSHDVLPMYEEACSLSDEELPPLPDNYELPKDEPEAVKENLNPEAITPAIRMRDEYNDRDWRVNRWIYHRLTENVDALVGEILDGLKEAGLEENTLVIFTSDHGNNDAAHRLTSKSLFYEESVGVPFILKYPAAIPAGTVDTASLISTGLDILPTLFDYAGVTKPGHILGASVRPLAEAGVSHDWRTYVVSENDWFRMILTDDYKYCAFISEGREWLGDMENDPGEMRNLVDDPDHAGALAEHRKLLAKWSELSGDSKIDSFQIKK